VGTKADLRSTKPDGKRRQVQFSQAVALCNKLGLAGCFEVSSKSDLVKEMPKTNSSSGSLFKNLDEAFFMVACNCVDQTTRQIMGELIGPISEDAVSKEGDGGS